MALINGRTLLVPGDSLRDFTVVWSRDGGANGANPQLEPVGGGTPVPLTAFDIAGGGTWERDYYRGLALWGVTPAAGSYTLTVGGVSAGTVTVQALVTRPTVKLSNANYTGARLVSGAGKEITLQPGTYRLPTTKTVLTAGQKLRGFGQAVIEQMPTFDSNGACTSTMYQIPEDCTFEGIHFRVPGLFAENIGATGGRRSVFHECKFSSSVPLRGSVNSTHAKLGNWDHGECLFSRCTFDRFSCYPVYGGIFYDCLFEGIGGGSEFVCDGQFSPLALINCRFKNTGRGPGFRSGLNTNDDGLMVGLTCEGIGHYPNASEYFGTEGAGNPGMNRWLILRTRIYGGCGQVMFWDGPAADNIIRDLWMERGAVIFSGEAVQTGNALRDIELHGGGFAFGALATSNTLLNCASYNFTLNRQNQDNVAASYYDPADKSPFKALGANAATNVATDCYTFNRPAGIAESIGLTWVMGS